MFLSQLKIEDIPVNVEGVVIAQDGKTKGKVSSIFIAPDGPRYAVPWISVEWENGNLSHHPHRDYNKVRVVDSTARNLLMPAVEHESPAITAFIYKHWIDCAVANHGIAAVFEGVELESREAKNPLNIGLNRGATYKRYYFGSKDNYEYLITFDLSGKVWEMQLVVDNIGSYSMLHPMASNGTPHTHAWNFLFQLKHTRLFQNVLALKDAEKRYV